MPCLIMKELFFNGEKRSTNNTTLLSQFNVLKNAHTNLSTEALAARKNRSQHLNQRDPNADVPTYNDVLEIC